MTAVRKQSYQDTKLVLCCVFVTELHCQNILRDRVSPVPKITELIGMQRGVEEERRQLLPEGDWHKELVRAAL